jgi:hypothetical protein
MGYSQKASRKSIWTMLMPIKMQKLVFDGQSIKDTFVWLGICDIVTHSMARGVGAC